MYVLCLISKLKLLKWLGKNMFLDVEMLSKFDIEFKFLFHTDTEMWKWDTYLPTLP